MSSKTKNFILQIGKGFRKVDTRSSINGVPNTNLDSYDNKTGKFLSRRKFDNQGRAKKDLDKGHSTHNKQDHAHDFTGQNRGYERDLSKKEKRELNKASKKRRF